VVCEEEEDETFFNIPLQSEGGWRLGRRPEAAKR
jgi:hypothetical protein